MRDAKALSYKGAGFDFNEKQELVISSDNVEFTAMRAAEISGKNFTTLRAEPSGSDLLTVIADPDSVTDLAVSPRQVIG